MDPSPATVDMSPEAIAQRLRDLGQLYRLGISLEKARPLGSLDEVQRRLEASRASEASGASERNPRGQ